MVQRNGWGRGRRPVIGVSWFDAIAYCNWLSHQEGYPPAYNSQGRLLDHNGRPTTDITKVRGYRLPTESEWAYAAQGGHRMTFTGREKLYFLFPGSNSISEVAWYKQNSGNKTQIVGQKKANQLGLYDMSGNVYEWCHDWYGRYTDRIKNDPIGPTNGTERILRGGCYHNDDAACRITYRNHTAPGDKYRNVGFRIARTIF